MDKMAQDLTIENFKELLSHPKWKETDPHSKEYVFEYPVIKNSDRMVVKVCSSISKTLVKEEQRQGCNSHFRN